MIFLMRRGAFKQVPILPKIKERIEAIRKLRPKAERAEVRIGKGALIERVRKRAVEATEKIQEAKPGIIPKIGEVLSQWYPGKRLVTIITPKTEIVKPGEYVQKEAEKTYRPPEREGVHY